MREAFHIFERRPAGLRAGRSGRMCTSYRRQSSMAHWDTFISREECRGHKRARKRATMESDDGEGHRPGEAVPETVPGPRGRGPGIVVTPMGSGSHRPQEIEIGESGFALLFPQVEGIKNRHERRGGGWGQGANLVSLTSDTCPLDVDRTGVVGCRRAASACGAQGAPTIPERDTVGVMFACVGRGAQLYGGRGNVEADAFRKAFPACPCLASSATGRSGATASSRGTLCFEVRQRVRTARCGRECGQGPVPQLHHRLPWCTWRSNEAGHPSLLGLSGTPPPGPIPFRNVATWEYMSLKRK
ncbi:hypothetical protein QTO34_008957 [Cnephaeus nilssonii]|uniref:Uncharacterized protein n=1 Tax=Cnephaeus nilssonii TaxID=3371016 RepID=A0AA40HHX9_CNENI|nr:hypothetical protein QTO34_008957 [Eptesicus nilssonii]